MFRQFVSSVLFVSVVFGTTAFAQPGGHTGPPGGPSGPPSPRRFLGNPGGPQPPPPSTVGSVRILRHYPIANAKEVSVVTQIGITAASAFNPSVTSPRYWSVLGSISGVHNGTIHLSNDSCTAIFAPDIPFVNNENVSVDLGIAEGPCHVFECTFSFTTEVQTLTPAISNKPPFADYAIMAKVQPSRHTAPMKALDAFCNTTVDNDPTPGRIFYSAFGVEDMGELVITDEHSNMLFNVQVAASDFVRQPNGEYSYFIQPPHYVTIDTSGNVLQSFSCTNGITTDGHEFRIEKNGNYYLLGMTTTTGDLSEVGGQPGTTVQGGAIQAFDSSGNLIFEWRGIDHYRVQDDVQPGDLQFRSVDFEHVNSIDIDSEGNYLLSNRNLSEVTKIDAQTGAMLWRFGGNNNQFKLVGDTDGISCQHFARWLKNGDILLFDNGVYHAVQESRAVEFRLDTVQMTATLTWQYRHDPPLFADVMGNAERLRNGNTFIGWGSNLIVSSTEVDSNGTVIFESALPWNDNSYRAMKYSTVSTASASITPVSSSSPADNLSIAANAAGYEITASLASPSEANLAVYDAAGREVVSVYRGNLSSKEFLVPSGTLSSGVYFCVLRSENGTIMKPMAIVR